MDLSTFYGSAETWDLIGGLAHPVDSKLAMDLKLAFAALHPHLKTIAKLDWNTARI
ncbi:hypothetical protein BG011_003979 [Mortierella polycephala]|uniref:Uncharacterized protein n=1 Tax=Mortierella polycephala TaxID=41804 RepID=A0A9P6QH62_9FUNG|nr:hypothetical protein BG011_003979 [Mortierella polycephala]